MAALELRFPKALSVDAQETLVNLRSVPAVDDMYLAGSAALALYLGHREVSGLDWMAAGNRLRPADRRDLLEALLEVDPETRVETARDGLLFVRTGNGTAVKFFYYPYPLIEGEQSLEELWVGSAVDLALMKLGAIISRGTKRDFIDWYLISRHLPIGDVLDRASEKFGHVLDFPLQALKGLADFSATAGQPTPSLVEPLEWSVVVSTIEHEVREEADRRLSGPEGSESRGSSGG